MDVTLLAENLQKKIALVNHAVSPRPTLPILGSILFQATQNGVDLFATDLEIGIHTQVNAKVTEEGIVAIPAKLFSELIAILPQEKIHCTTQDNTFIVASGKTKSVLQTMPKDEFPSLYETEGEIILEQDFETLKKYFSMVMFAASFETTKPALTGVCLKQEGTSLVFVATDGYRLSIKSTTEKIHNPQGEKDIIIPLRIVRELLSLKSEGKMQIRSAKENNQILFKVGETTLVGRLIEATFPNYQKILPQEATTKVRFDREELFKAVKTSAIFAKDAGNVITLALKKESITVSAKASAIGESVIEVSATLTGEENDIAFNARYLLDILGSDISDEMVFEMTGPLNPGVFKIPGDTSFLHVIMPIRT